MKFLPRLPLNVPMTDSAGNATTAFQRYWQEFAEAIELAFDGINTNVTAIQAALDAAGIATAAAATANAAAATAQAAATTAQATTDATVREAALTTSYVTGLTLGALDAGTNATVNISAHTRVYGDGTSVAVNAGSLTGLPYNKTVRVYYDDPTRAGGAVTYASTVDPATPPVQSGDRHSVGAVITPVGGGAPSGGFGIQPPGFVLV